MWKLVLFLNFMHLHVNLCVCLSDPTIWCKVKCKVKYYYMLSFGLKSSFSLRIIFFFNMEILWNCVRVVTEKYVIFCNMEMQMLIFFLIKVWSNIYIPITCLLLKRGNSRKINYILNMGATFYPKSWHQLEIWITLKDNLVDDWFIM